MKCRTRSEQKLLSLPGFSGEGSLIGLSDNKTVPGFVIYRATAMLIKFLQDGERERTLDAILAYFLYGEEPELTGNAKEVFDIARKDIDKAESSYRLKQDGGKRGAARRWGKL